MAMKVSRFALLYNPPTLMVEYQDPTEDAKFIKKINIKNISKVKESNTLVNELRSKYPHLLGPAVVEEAQVKGLVERLIQSVRDTLSSPGSNSKQSTALGSSNSSPTPTGTVMFKRVAVPTSEADLAALDLNVVSEEVNRTAKHLMDGKFEANRLKPGDPGYVYDKAVDFEAPSEAAGWDSDEDSD